MHRLAFIALSSRSRFSLASATLLLPVLTTPASAKRQIVDAPALLTPSAKTLPASRIAPPRSVQAPVLLAQLAPGDQDVRTPATVQENPGGLSVPIGPEKTNEVAPEAPPAPTPTPIPAPATAPAPAPEITVSGVQTPPIIGNVEASEGREVSDVRIVGNRVIPAATIQAQIRSARAAAFSSRLATQDQGRIAKLGFFASVQVQVAPDLTTTNRVVVTYIVVENREVKGVTFTGNTALKSEDLTKVIKSQPDRIANFNIINEDIEAITRAYRQKGFIALVQSAGQSDDGTLVFDLLEARVSKIEFKGLRKTRPGLVRKQILTRVGDLFNEVQLQKDRNRIYDMNFFQVPPDLDVQNDPEKPGFVIVTLQFVERPTGQFSIGVGFDSRSKISGFLTLTENNFRGTGRRAVASVETGSRRNFELGFGDPFVGNKNASYDVSIYKRTLFREQNLVERLFPNSSLSSASSVDEDRTGGRFSFTSPLDYERNRTLIFGYRNENARTLARDLVDTNGDGFGDRDVVLDEGRVSAFSAGFLLDRRDIRIDPSRGTRASLTVEQGLKFLGGETSFTKTDLDLRAYAPLGSATIKGGQPKMVLAGRIVLGRSFQQLPTFEQYYIGGSDTVRGYDADEQFGDNQLFGNIELRYRVQQRFQFVGFFDAGTAYGGRFSSSKSADLLTGFGVGARIQTPIGPIRLDLGRGQDGVRTHFAMGTTF